MLLCTGLWQMQEVDHRNHHPCGQQARARRRQARPGTRRAGRAAAKDITYDRVRAGLDVADVTTLIAEGVLTSEEVHKVVPPRALARQKSREERLTVQESDGIARPVRVAAHAARVFDDPDLRSAWLRSGNPAPGRERPIDLATIDIGARRVERVFHRVAWGDYS